MEKRAVLFVDDDELMLRSLRRGFLDERFDGYFAKSGAEALEILRRQEVHVIVTDMCMPEMSGTELIKIVNREYPHVVSVVLSGYAKNDDIIKAVHQEGIFKFVSKTLTLEKDLKPIVQQAIDHFNARTEHKELVTNSGIS
jgi:DNA-binding NtrC family response regulator